MIDSDRRGLFLDLDGTVAASLDVLEAVYYDFMSDFKLKGSKDEFKELSGPSLDTVVSIIKDRYGIAESHEVLIKQYSKKIHDQFMLVPLADGVLDLLKQAEKFQYLVAIVSSNSEKIIKQWLIEKGIDAKISAIIGNESVSHGKPNPEPYLRALAETNCSAIHSFAVEDTLIGAQSAIAAGLKTILITKNDFKELPALHRVIKNIAEVLQDLTE